MTWKNLNIILKNKINEIDKALNEKDEMIESIINSMMGKFKKIEERLFELERSEETRGEVTFCNPSSLEKPCIDITEDEKETDELNFEKVDLKDASENIISEKEISKEISQKEISEPTVEIFKCDLCDFRTPHNQGLTSHMTKMHGMENQHSCEQCSETFPTRKKLKNHIYCIQK